MVNNIFILNKNLETTKILSIHGINVFFDDIYTLDISTCTESFEFSTTVENITKSDYVMFYYHNKYKLFQIIDIEQVHSDGKIITTIYSETACLELLNDVVREFSGEYNCITFLEHVLQNSGWQIGNYSTSLRNTVINVDVTQVTQKWACIQDYMSVFKYEISPRVIYDNGHITRKILDVFAEGGLGEHTYKRFEYGRNVSGITKKEDLYEWCTALIIKSEHDLTTTEYNKNGYVKPETSDIMLAPTENKIYNAGKNYIYGYFDVGNSIDATDALEKAAEELKRRATPRFDYECTTALTYEEYKQINLGDTVYCIDNTFLPPLTLEARIGKLEISFSDRTKCNCTLSNYKEVKSKIGNENLSEVENIINKYFPITSNGIADGAITDGKIDTKYYQQISADIVSAGKVVTEELIAKEVVAIDGKFDNLESVYAKITNLDATNANITSLTAVLAEIQTLVGGHLTMDNIQSLVLTSDKVTIDNALIKDAMIDTISANKVNTGTLNTNNVSIQSSDGSMLLQGNLQQFKDNDGNVRIQIGKDATGNFTFSLFDASGTGVLIDETGIKSGAVGDGLIVNGMISDDANISGGKLDISSVISSINDNENTLLSSKIKFSDTDQTLDVAFNQLKTKVETIENVTIDGDLSSVIEQVSTNTTNIGIAQGQISSLISNTTITKQDGTVVQLKDEYNSTKDTVNSHTTAIGSLETNYNKVTGDIAEVSSKQASLEQNLDGFKTTVSDTYLSKDDAGNTYATQANLTQVEQTANKISWLVASGTSKSDMVLTDDLFRIISNNITLTADRINLNGYISNNTSNWSIDVEGNMNAYSLSVDGELSAGVISCKEINGGNLVTTLSYPITIYVNASSGSDLSSPIDGAVFATLQGAIFALPKYLGGKSVKIIIQNNLDENTIIQHFNCGSIEIYLNGYTVYGCVEASLCTASIIIYGGNVDNPIATQSIMHPAKGIKFDSKSVTIGFDSCSYGAVYSVKVYGSDMAVDTESDDRVCIAAKNSGFVYCDYINIVNASIAFRATYGAHLQVVRSAGIAGKYGFQVSMAGQISLGNNTQAGGFRSNTNGSSGGQIHSETPSFSSGNQTTDSMLSPQINGSKALQYNSLYGASYLSDESSWNGDNTVRQGKNGYGDYTGLWFFGSIFNEIRGKNITKIVLTVSRQRGGNYSEVELAVKCHGYEHTPKTSPTIGLSAGTIRLPIDATGTLTITDANIIAGVKNGTIKGFAIQSTSDSKNYAVCSGSVSIRFYYSE